jgi:response regulator NasT
MKTAVVVIADRISSLHELAQALGQAGCRVVGQFRAEEDWPPAARALEPDGYVVAVQDVTPALLDALAQVDRLRPRPIALFTDDPDRQHMAAAMRHGATAYVVRGFSPARVPHVLDEAAVRFAQLDAMRSELGRLSNALAERKLIERAKGLVMQQRGCTEDQAYQLLRKTSMDQKRRLVDVAREVIRVTQVFGGE